MIPIEPFDLTNSFPFDPVSYYLHMIIGVLAVLAALVALSAKKGSRVHILAGRTFAVCVLIVSITSMILLSVRMVAPLMVATSTAIYAVGTALLALKPAAKKVRIAEYALSALQITVVVIFLTIAVPQVMQGNIPPIGPLVILVIPLVLLVGDVNFYRKAKHRPTLRTRRHLSRMIWVVIIVVRAPLVEVNSVLQIPPFLLLIGPLIIAPIMIAFFIKRFPKVSHTD